ncbi:DUF4183 domain-containing protein [Paenibacillus cellulosilyticus]|uniref:DUF4183 domain-containing protein n=1 Tax=Paenibacillus cellulosilyticus TaxID=375489 RepID=UPI001C2E7613|nr:DUF4183 domain-containing protein [Paenibacillus cellulosilyticus]
MPAIVVTSSINRYFYIPDIDLDLISSITLPANLFTDDTGNAAAEFIGLGQGSYNNLYVNGIMQPGGIYTVSPASLFFPSQDSMIYAGTSIVLEIVQLTAHVDN